MLVDHRSMQGTTQNALNLWGIANLHICVSARKCCLCSFHGRSRVMRIAFYIKVNWGRDTLWTSPMWHARRHEKKQTLPTILYPELYHPSGTMELHLCSSEHLASIYSPPSPGLTLSSHLFFQDHGNLKTDTCGHNGRRRQGDSAKLKRWRKDSQLKVIPG